MPSVRSEAAVWERVRRLALRLMDRSSTVHESREIGATLHDMADEMTTQLQAGFHRNIGGVTYHVMTEVKAFPTAIGGREYVYGKGDRGIIVGPSMKKAERFASLEKAQAFVKKYTDWLRRPSIIDHNGTPIVTQANPTLEYARAVGGRILRALAGTKSAALAERVTHHLMTGRLDKVTISDAEDLVDALEKGGHHTSAGQFAKIWNEAA